MFKLLVPGLMIAPVLALAFVADGHDPFANAKTTKTPATAVLASASMDVSSTSERCGSETFGVTFSHGLLESHSADALGEAFTADAACEIAFIRLTSLVAEEDEVAIAGIAEERTELAEHISALVGETRARDLRVYHDVQTTALDNPHHYHALVRVERRPVNVFSFAEARVSSQPSAFLD